MRPWLRVPGDWRRPVERAEYMTYWCDRCAFGMVHPSPTPDEVARAYDVDYYTHDAHWGGARRRTIEQRVREHLAWRVDRSKPTHDALADVLAGPPLRICEIGCGNGLAAGRMRDLGHHLTCVEIDPAARAIARDRGLEVHEGTAEQLPAALEGQRFDVVVMIHVLEHCIDPVAAMRNVARLLEPSGRFVCEVPNNTCRALERSGPAWAWFDVPRHLLFFSESSLRALCSAQQLRVEEVRYTGYYRQIAEPWVNEEQRIHDALSARGTSVFARNSARRAWGLLARTAFAPDAQKYDSLMIVARA
ncbi:class I SAM-dependent methyltransferase [Sandaracinus amylolyticus]|uniref:SAM-dependent methyltransferase n=1 Tax=Sandaracinus amylolyticus TaxID=927083 RepID=A0A0F6YIA6_9BACT|nr:class I SAM-dependent methyltransferase [Sandaracinus amylolyticus]AKF06782.1 SAM-dependent methyltransferase [Sandaracinus amylolyticus]